MNIDIFKTFILPSIITNINNMLVDFNYKIDEDSFLYFIDNNDIILKSKLTGFTFNVPLSTEIKVTDYLLKEHGLKSFTVNLPKLLLSNNSLISIYVNFDKENKNDV